MIGVGSIESLAAGDGRHNLFRTLGPTLLISMGYIDLGKWLATVDAGSRFGYDQVLLVLLFNFSAILFHYQSICVGMVTGKNLAEICCQEYNRTINVVLGLQAGLSLIAAELTMVSGIAVGFNLVFECGDLVTSMCFSSIVVNLLPYVTSRLGRRMAGTVNACIAGFTLLCFVLGLLVSQPKIPVNMNVMFPKLSGESAYSLMALLGSNVITHNFYVHSSVVQVQRRFPAPTLGSLFHDHLFSILFIFTGIFLLNYVLVSSAADESSNITLVNYQDGIELMNQIFVSPAAPVVLLVILLFSSHIISLTSIIGSDVILKSTLGLKLPHSAHHLLLKGFAIIPSIYRAKVADFEGLYQLLVLCPVIQAMFIPSAVIPLLRISSSRLIMGSYKMSLYAEIFAILAFLLMLFTNIIFAAEILFGDSSWTNNLKGNSGGPVLLPHIVVVLTSFATIAFTLFLAVTPLKSASNEAESEELSVHSQSETSNIAHSREETSLENAPLEEVQWSSVDVVPRDLLEGHRQSALEHTESSETAAESDHDAQEPTSHRADDSEADVSQSEFCDEPKFVEVDWTEPMSKVCTDSIGEQSTAENIKVKSATEKNVRVEPDVNTQKDSEVTLDLEFDKSYGGKVPSFTSGSGNDTDAGNVSGVIAKHSGLGRASRRQLAAILDEFWGHFFDYHGKLTQEANTKWVNFLIGLDLRAVGSAVKKDSLSIEASRSPIMRDAMQRSATVLNTRDSRDKKISNQDMGFGPQMGTMGSPTWSRSMHLPNIDIPSSGRTFLQQNAKLYSNFHTPSYSNNQFYQPATIHGYQLANYLKGLNASRNPYSSTPMDPWQPPRSSDSVIPNNTGSAMNAPSQNLLGPFGARSLQSPALNRLSTMTVERSYYDPISVGESESVGSSANSKKYHSSPDISAVIAASRDALLNEANFGGSAANLAYLSRLASEKSGYVDSAGRPSSPLTELSQHNVQRDMMSVQSSMNTNAKSLWSQQPFEQLFGVSSSDLKRSEVNTGRGSSSVMKDDFSYTECEAELLNTLRFCITKLLKLEGSGWLFSQDGGCDENLIDQVSEAERVLQETSGYRDASSMHKAPNCGEACVWQASLIVSFGVWCIRRVLDLSRMESRPELWGKYTYVLNRLQGIIDPAFSRPRKPLAACVCLPEIGPVGRPIPGSFITAAMILEVIKGVEQAVSGRKGRSGTAAGDVAFPKGKENLASVLKRYKRRLANYKTTAGR